MSCISSAVSLIFLTTGEDETVVGMSMVLRRESLERATIIEVGVKMMLISNITIH
jgi:hypothetical protein